MSINAITPGPQFPTPRGYVVTAAQAAATTINKAGGINGRPIEIVPCDTKGDPNGSSACARQAVSSGDILAVVGTVDSNPGYLDILKSGNIPDVGSGISAPSLANTISYPITGSGSIAVVAAIELAVQKVGAKGVNGTTPITFVLASNAPQAAVTLIQNTAKLVYPKADLRFVPLPVATTDASAVVAEATRDSGAVALGTTSTPDTVQFLTAYKASGTKVPLTSLTFSITSEVIDQLGKDAINGISVASLFMPTDYTKDPQVKAFDAAMTKADPKAIKNDSSQSAWAGVYLVAEIAKGLTTVDSASLQAALNATTAVTPPMLPSINFTQAYTSVPGLTRLFNPFVMYSVFKNGKAVPITGQFVNAVVPPKKNSTSK